MKRFANLYDRMFASDNIRKAIIEASRHKRKNRYSVRYCLENTEEVIERIQANPHITGEYREILRKDPSSGKERRILVPRFFPDQIIQHCVFRVLNPLIERSYYRYSCSCIKGRGQVYASNHLRRVLKSDRKRTKYYVKLDVRKYYDSVDHDVLKAKCRRLIKDDKALRLLDEIIDSVPRGIPIGNYSSQIFANMFLTEADHFIKETLRVPHYLRFADDMVLLSGNKRRLERQVGLIREHLNSMKLGIHGNEAIKETDGGFIDFVGYRHYRGKTAIRRRIFRRLRRVALRLRRRICIARCRRMMSYNGFVVHSDSKRIRERYYKPLDIGFIKSVLGGHEYAVSI